MVEQVLGGKWRESLEEMGHRAFNVSTDEVFTIVSSNLIQYGTTRTLKACWQRWVLHRRWETFEA